MTRKVITGKECMWTAEQQGRKGVCAAIVKQPGIDADDTSIPRFSAPDQYDIPVCERPKLALVLKKFPELFLSKPGKTTVECHYISSTGCPAKLPP